jgi:hypothetical protein
MEGVHADHGKKSAYSETGPPPRPLPNACTGTVRFGQNGHSAHSSAWNRRIDTMSEHDVVANQKTILGNQAKILENQKTLLQNQAEILKNQAALDEILANQKTILANQKTIVANQKESLPVSR